MNSPFKFLDPYGPEDIKAFFGRTTETQELYSLVTKNRLTFVYGPSGSGKTSLVRCGLANRFRGIDWLPLFIRRGENINQSLKDAVEKKLERLKVDENNLGQSIESLFSRFLRPVYLIFDQFEELFILGDRDEKKERQPFYETIADLLDSELPLRILFIMREDYFGHLNKFEQFIPELYHRKLRVEPMSRENLRQVIVGSCKVYNIPFGDKEDPKRILDNLFEDRTTVQMPFVQVYLHKLYTKAAKLQKTNGEADAPVVFNQTVIDHMGPLENVLGFFLEDQEATILKELAPLQPPKDIVRRVLDIFVTEEGTKIPITIEKRDDDKLLLRGRAAEYLYMLDHELVSACLIALVRNRILRRTEDKLEIAHDTLAALIDRQRTNEQRQLNEMRRRIEIGYLEHRDAKGTYFFDRGQLARVEPFLDQISLKPEWKTFLEDSRKDCEARENAERVRAQKELQLAEAKLAAEQEAQEARELQLQLAEENLKNEQQARRRQRRLTRLVTAIAITAVIASIFAFIFNVQAQQRRAEAEQALCDAQREELRRKQLQLSQADLNRTALAKVGETLNARAVTDSIEKLTNEISELEQNLASCE